MHTAKQLLSAQVVTGFPEQRLSYLATHIEQLGAQCCAVIDPGTLTIVGLIRFSDVAAHPGLSSRILADLMRAPPVHQLRETDPADAAAGIFETFGAQEIAVVSPLGEYVGLITPASFSSWLLENERTRKIELERLLADQKRLVDFLERKVDSRRVEMRAAMDEFNRVSLSLSHDIRGPLGSIRGFAEILVRGEGGELNDDGREAAQRIQRAATKLELMANTLLEDASRLFGERARPFATIDLNEVFADALDCLDAQIRERGARVIARGRLHQIDGLYVPILQVFVNVIGNAMKFVPEGQNPSIEIWTEDTSDGVLLSIKDNGFGVSHETRKKLFEPFASRPHPQIAGTGLGLAITRNAVDELQGRVDLTSEDGQGTVFSLTLRRSSGNN